MKTTTDKLFKLIKSMTPAEKRYFKRHYGSASNTLTHLYDAINIQKDYDEENIKMQFPGKVALNLKVYKFQLEQLLLKSLTSHRHGANVGNKIRMGIEHFEILLEKNLLQMAEKQLKKTKQTCLDYERYAYLPVILAKEAKLQQIQANGFSSNVAFIHEDAAIYSEKLVNHYRYSSKLNALIDFYHQSQVPISQAELDAFLRKIDISSPKHVNDTPLPDRLISSIIKGIKQLLIGEFQLAAHQLEEVIQFFVKNTDKADHFAHFYLNSLYGALDASLEIKDMDKVREYLKLGQAFCRRNPIYLSKALVFATYEIKLHIQESTCDLFIHQQLDKYESLIDELDLEEELDTLLFYAWVALAALFAEEAMISQQMVRKIQECQLEKTKYLKAFGRIMEFVIYFETPNFQKIIQFLERIKNEKKLRLSQHDKLFFEYFLNFANGLAIDPRSAPSMARQFLANMRQIPQVGPGSGPGSSGYLMRLFQSYRLDRWLQAIADEYAFLEKMNSSQVA